ncbi:MAG: protein tyrosine phosphatase [Deltaproteobacteria bacterium]|nr:protein tyrosine phosphatase [Deltaproteobacteria bacterium]
MPEFLAGEGFIDLHCHLLHGVDDGPEGLPGGLDIAAGLKALGWTCIVATPHVRPGLYDPSDRAVLESLRDLRAAIGAGGPRVLLAGEHYLDAEVWQRIADGRGRPYPNGRSILIEISTAGPAPARLSEQLFRMRVGGLRPVLAHPERCAAFQDDTALLEELRRAGVAVALDLTSLVGQGGRRSRRTAERFLELDLVDVACTDTHDARELPDVEKALARLRKLCGDEALERLLHAGPTRIALDNPAPPAEVRH